MTYEYITKRDITWEEAVKVMEALVKRGLNPEAVSCDPAKKSVKIYFRDILDPKIKEKLDETMKKLDYMVM